MGDISEEERAKILAKDPQKFHDAGDKTFLVCGHPQGEMLSFLSSIICLSCCGCVYFHNSIYNTMEKVYDEILDFLEEYFLSLGPLYDSLIGVVGISFVTVLFYRPSFPCPP